MFFVTSTGIPGIYILVIAFSGRCCNWNDVYGGEIILLIFVSFKVNQNR